MKFVIEGDNLKTRTKNEIDCEEVQSRIFEYLDGELVGKDLAKFSAHIMNCPKCRDEVEECRHMLEEIKKVDYSVPSGLHENVMALVGSTVRERPSYLKKLGFGFSKNGKYAAIGTLATACAVFALVMLGNFRNLRNFDAAASGAIPEEAENEGVLEDNTVTETFGALTFSSPMTTVNETEASNDTDSYVLRDIAGGSVEPEKYGSYDLIKDENGIYIEIYERNNEFYSMISNLVESKTAVLILPYDSNVGKSDGDEVKISGYEDILFREIYDGDLSEKLLEFETELDFEGSVYKVIMPEDEYNCILLAYLESADTDVSDK